MLVLTLSKKGREQLALRTQVLLMKSVSGAQFATAALEYTILMHLPWK